MDSSQSDIRARRSSKSFAGYVHCYKSRVEQDGLSALQLHAQLTQGIQCCLLLANLCHNVSCQYRSLRDSQAHALAGYVQRSQPCSDQSATVR